jgi:hypothetical protein
LRGGATERCRLSSPVTSGSISTANKETVQQYREELFSWLAEEYDKAERKQTWSITMEVLITLFVGMELLIEGLRLVGFVH